MNKYWIKSFILKSSLFEEYKKIGRTLFYFRTDSFREYKDGEFKRVIPLELTENDYDIETALDINSIYLKRYPHLWKECKRIYHAHLNRVIRLKKRISDMVYNHNCIFLTITFTDKALKSNSEQSRREAIRKYLSSFQCPYVANKDFGDNHLYKARDGSIRTATSREHYHAVIQTDRIDYSQWKYGRINGKKVRNTTKDLTKISKYVAKLTNHAIKESTKRSVILYSRT